MTRQRLTSMLQFIGYGLVSMAVGVAFVTVRLMSDGREGIKQATFALETGNRALAAANLEDAAKSYVPGSPFPRRALRELIIMARAAEIRGSLDESIAYWENVRRAIIATRHFFQPNADLLTVAEHNLVRIRSNAGPIDLSIDLTYRQRDPSPFLSILLFLGLLIWIGGAVLIILSPRERDGALLVRKGYAWTFCLLGLCLWIVSAALV